VIVTVRQARRWSATLLDRRTGLRQALHFWIGVYTKAVGRLAKNERIDAVVLAWFADTRASIAYKTDRLPLSPQVREEPGTLL